MSSETPFEPIGHASVADSVVVQIEDMIASGVLREGRKLPSERDLAEALEVSRPKLREALQTLEERGLLKVRHGEGSFVAPLTGQAMSPALLSLYSRHESAFFDYLEYRREQEGFASRLAAQRATKSDKARIEKIMKALQDAWQAGDDAASREADFLFHSAIVDASHNATLIHMMASIYDLTKQGLFYNRAYLKAIDGSGKELLAQHLAIGSAVVSGDADGAEQAATKHMDFVERSFRAGQEQNRREMLAEKRRILSG